MSALLKMQIGPVQEFIAQARSTRDLWSGSYLLSWLVAAGIRHALKNAGARLVFPAREGQPLLDLEQEIKKSSQAALLTPNLPNLFVLTVEGTDAAATDLAKQIETEIRAEWENIAKAVWRQRSEFGLEDSAKERFKAQVKRHLAISWQVTAIANDSPESYREAYRRNGWHLDAVRQLRDFKAWDLAPGSDDMRLTTDKDSLSGREEAVVGGKDFLLARQAQKNEHSKLFKHADHLGAVTLIKRVWHLAYLQRDHELRSGHGHGQHFIRSVPAIAARELTRDEEESGDETGGDEKYIAVVAFDGDSIGAWLNGDKSPAEFSLAQHHTDFSKALSAFAMSVAEVVEEEEKNAGGKKVPLGQLIYAGGDDVVCLLPADAALRTVERLRHRFVQATLGTPAKGDQSKPDASTGIAIGHIHAPLQDLIREAQKAQKRAKTAVGAPAFSITLMKRSGEISFWGSSWSSVPAEDSGGPVSINPGLKLYSAITDRLKPGGLSAKFPHRVCQLLTPYLIAPTKLMNESRTLRDAIEDIAVAQDLITREFAHAAERQGSKELARELDAPLRAYLASILTARAAHESRGGRPAALTALQELLRAVIDLCTTVAFAQRTAPDSTPAE